MTPLQHVLTLLRDSGVTLEIKKCLFIPERNNSLGHVLRPGRPKPSETTTAAVHELNDPMTQTELRSFLSIRSVFRRFVSNVSRVAASLNRKLRKDQPTSSSSLATAKKDILEDLKTPLTNLSILALPRPSESTTMLVTLKLDLYHCNNRETPSPSQLDTGRARSTTRNRSWQLSAKCAWL